MTLGVDPNSAAGRELVEAHQKRLVGWFRARVRDRSQADDLVQRTWLEVLPRLHLFDPERGTFWAFTRNRARHLLQRHWEESARRADSLEQRTVESSADEAAGGAARDDFTAGHPYGLSRVFLEMLTRTVTCRRLPHEIVAFGFIKLLGWKPQRLVAELGAASTLDAAIRLRDEYLRDVPAPAVHAVFEQLLARMNAPLRLFEVDRRTLAPYEALADRVAGAIRVHEYVPEDGSPEEAVTRWWAAVSRAVATDLVQRSDGPLAEWLADHPSLRQRHSRSAGGSTPSLSERNRGETA